jgi:hypothetical protein
VTNKQLEAALIANGWDLRRDDRHSWYVKSYKISTEFNILEIMFSPSGAVHTMIRPNYGTVVPIPTPSTLAQLAALCHGLGIPFDPAAGNKEGDE